MKVLEGLEVVRKFFPGVKIDPKTSPPTSIAVSVALHMVALEREPETAKELIRRMDSLGLSVKDGFVGLFG